MINIIGLNNYGNTCYINSAIQVFMNCTDIIENILSHNCQNYNFFLLKQLITAYKESDYNNYNIIITQLLNIYSKIQNINTSDQCDSSLFFNFLLDIINDNSNIKDIYQSKFCTIIQCNNNHTIFKYQNENFINVYPLSKINNLEDLLSSELSKTYIDNYTCDHCTNNQSTQISHNKAIINIGNYLFINIVKILNYNCVINPMYKFEITTPINIEQKIFENNNCDINNKLKLYGFICHFGSIIGGHYIACVYKNNNWYKCNDMQVNKITNENVKELIKSTTFLLYKKIL